VKKEKKEVEEESKEENKNLDYQAEQNGKIENLKELINDLKEEYNEILYLKYPGAMA
jgi:hypothetical protein